MERYVSYTCKTNCKTSPASFKKDTQMKVVGYRKSKWRAHAPWLRGCGSEMFDWHSCVICIIRRAAHYQETVAGSSCFETHMMVV